MLKIGYPAYNFKIKSRGNKEIIFDEVRKIWVTLTPEEWVRQNFLQWLIQKKKYPAGLMAVEKKIMVNQMPRRCDILVYKNEKPWLLVECKEPATPLDEKTIWQILNYNITLTVQYLIITNGASSFCFKIEDGQVEEMEELPGYG